jgi:hypothetical protein
MNATSFFSDQTYLVLPTKASPRVYLSIDNRKMAGKALMLYNPFSKKAKVLKAAVTFLSIYFNPLSKFLLPTIKAEKSLFIKFLEEKLNTELISSVYLATAKDKVVLQLQDDKGILGYLKYPLTEQGKERLLKEKQGISEFAKKSVVPNLILDDVYGETPFILIQNIKGRIGHLDNKENQAILTAFIKETSFKLMKHPRILDLQSKLKQYGLTVYSNKLNQIISSSKNTYKEVLEHGDFTPWNLIRAEQGVVPFDFEYFEEHGLEHLDEIKYYFQIEHLLNGKKDVELIKAIATKIKIKEFQLIFQVFLIKEIVNKHGSTESYDFENSLLKKIF